MGLSSREGIMRIIWEVFKKIEFSEIGGRERSVKDILYFWRV